MTFMRLGCVGILFATSCLARPVAEVSPETSNLFVDQIEQTAIDKIDLLFMVDNSASMSDKQEILKAAVPVLLSRLVSPICVDDAGTPTGVSALANGQCPDDRGEAEFNPIRDIHIGIISSSLGAHGGFGPRNGGLAEAQCAEVTAAVVNPDDKAHLIGSLRPERVPLANTWNNSGFLAWDSAGTANQPPGSNDPKALLSVFQDMIGAVGERGCGYEASLESWYRFLVDPEPPASITRIGDRAVRGSKLTVNPDGSFGACMGCDETLLAQRKAFLRPDSLVAIIMLSDENDCSMRDEGSGWFAGSTARMPRSTVVCATNPNDPCCRSCAQGEDEPPIGCAALQEDANCKQITGTQRYATWDALHDAPNLRCYNQRQRFGFDLLYDTNRYVDALKNTTIQLQSTGQSVTNPLYASGGPGKAKREPSLVFLAGIVGVPWQDIADQASLADPKALTYLTAKELREQDRWPLLLGVPHPTGGGAPQPPSDPFMIETTEVRVGTNPIAKVSTSPANSTNPRANVINGHEQNIPDLADLQYACTFPLQQPKNCMPNDAACDCSPDRQGDSKAVVAANSPLCQGGANINQQMFAKAYPGVRELQVLKDLGDNAIVASICPKVTTPTGAADSDPNYGYNPAVGAIIERLKDALQGKCLPRPIETVDVDPTDPSKGQQLLCKVVEAQKSGCNCQLPGRQPADERIQNAVRKQLQLTGHCGKQGQPACSDWCQCEIKQEEGADLQACQTGGVAAPGYCYVDKDPGLLEHCPKNQQQLLRFVDDGTNPTPAQGAFTFIACVGAPLTSAP